MKLKHVVIAAAAAVALPAFAADPSATGRTRAEVRAEALGQKLIGEAGPQFFMDLPSMRTRAEVRAEARGLKLVGEAGVEFDFTAMSMLTREEVRAQLMAYGPVETTGA